jgi:hypothetical protein
MKITALQLSQAGFDADTVKSYVDTQIPLLEKAGFNKKEIYNSYGIVPIKSNSLLDTDMQDDTTAITENQMPLGKKTSLMKLQDDENADTIKSNKTSDGKYNLKNTTFDLLKNEDQAKIVNKIDEAYKLFKEDENGRVGFIDNWMEKYYPNIAYEKEKFKGGVDLTLAESALNDEQVKLLENAQAKDAIAGNFGFNQETGRYLFDTNFEQAEDERKANEPVNVLHTAFSTGANSKTILEYAKQNYQFNDMQIMYLNEFMSFVSALESNNRNIYNADGSAGGLFQFRKSGFRTALNRFVNINRKINKDYELPYWVTEAFKHQDPTRLSPDEQKSLALANFLEMPKSTKYNRAGSDQLIKAIANGDVDAMKKLYIEYHHADYEKVEDIEAGVGQEYRLVDNQKLKDRTDQYFDKFGTDKYDYETAQLAYWGNDNIVTKALEKLPANIGDKVLNAFGGKGYYNVFTNGYEQSVNGMLDRYYQVFIDDPNADPKEAIQKIFMYQEQRFDKDIVASAVTLVNDLPFMAAGCFAAGGTALAGSLGTAAPALPIICGAGGFALPEVLRSSYMRAIEDNFVGSFPEFLSHYMDKKTALVAGKSAVIGGVTFGVGAKVKALTGSTTARLATEVAVMTTLGAALEGHVPTMRDFAHATVLVFGIHGSIRGMKMFKDIYTEYGRHPRDVIKDMEKDVTVRHQIENGQMPTLYEQGAKTVVEGLEKQANIKLLPAPKFKNNEIVNVSTSSTEVGRVIGKETIGNEKVVIIEKTNGAKIPVLESEVRKAPNKPVEVKVEGDKININFAKDTSFAERKSNGEFNVNVVEVTKNKQNIYTEGTFKSNADLAVRDTGSPIRIVTKDGKTIANETITIQSKFYPELAKRFKENKEQKTEYKNAKELIIKERNGLSSIAKKVEVLFALKGNIEKMVLRVGKDNVAIPRSAYEQLIKFTEKGEVKTAEIMGSEGRQVIMMLHPETGKILATIKGEKINGEIDAQATNYFDNFKEKEGVHFDKVNSSKDGDNWGIPRDIFTQEKNLPADYANNSAAWKGLFNSAKGLDMIDLVELYKAFVKKSPELNNLPTGLNGYFQFKGKKSPRIVINEALQKNPEQFLMTFAHELGHLIDYLPNASLSRGNILGSIAALKGYMNKWIDGKNEGAKPLSPKEIEAIKSAAIKEAKAKEKETNAEIKQLEITPETILKIFNDASAREKINPDFYNAFVKLPAEVKKLVVKDAMKGLMSSHMKAIADKINGKPTDSRLTNEAYKIFKDKFERIIKERGLVNKEWITTELKNLSAKWKPFDRSARADYTAYRDGPRELMADFMMAFMLRPQWVKNNAPRTWEMWMHYMDARPEVRANWERIQIDLKSGTDKRLSKVVSDIGNMFRETNEATIKRIEKDYKPDLADVLGTEAIDNFFWIYRRFRGTGSDRWHSPLAKELNWSIENYRYRHAKLKRYTDDMMRKVVKPAEELGYNSIDIGTMLFLRNIAESSQRNKLVNSLGIMKVNPELAKVLGNRTAKEIYDYYVKLHPQLFELTNEFYKVRQEMVIPELKESGMYDKELIAKLENNKEYVTFNVRKYLLERIEKYGPNSSATRFLKGSKGTFDDIMNVFNATLEKDMLLMVEAKRHRTMALTVKWLKENKNWMEAYGKKSGEAYRPDRIIYKPKFIGEGRLEKPAKGMEQFSYMKDGKMQHWHVNKFVAQSFKENPNGTMMMYKIMTGTGDVFRKMFTEYNPAFWPINLARDLNRSVKLLPNARYIDIAGKGKNSLLKYYFKAVKPAYQSIFKDGTELTRWMESEGFLISMNEGYRGQAGSKALMKGLDPDTYMLERLLGDMQKKKGFDKFWNDTFGHLFSTLGNFARMFERTPKIAGTMYLRDAIKRGDLKMNDKEMMLRIQSEVGSPNFLRQGRLNAFTNNLYLYSNAFKEGWRADITRFREDPASVGGKFIAYNVMPKILQKMMEVGLFGTALGMVYKYGISDWDKINYIPIVLGETEDGRPVYLRIPQDETSRLINGFLYKAMSIGDDGKTGTFETPADLFGYLGSSGLPSMNPVFSLFGDVIGWMNGTTPYDDFRGTTAIDKTTDKADDARKNKELLKWFFNTYSGQGLYKFKSNDYKEISSELEEMLDMPVVGRILNRFVKIGNNPIVGFIENSEGGLQQFEKENAQVTLDFREAIKNLTTGEPLTNKHKMALLTRSEALKTNKLLIDRLSQMAGGTVLLQDFLTETDSKKQAIMVMKLVEFIEKTDNTYPINFIKEQNSDKIEE